MNHHTSHKKRNGFTLIEGVVLLFVFVVGVLSFYNLFILGTQQVIEAKKRLAAVALANERIEQFRNFPYDKVALGIDEKPVIDHSPDGVLGTAFNLESTIPVDEIVQVNNISFRVLIDVYSIDDPDDGISPADPIPADYKIVYITILWGSAINCADGQACQAAQQSIEIPAQFVPPGGLETLDGDGALSVNVLDSQGEPIADADVAVFNSSDIFAITPYDVIGQTDKFGNVLFYTGSHPAESGGTNDLEPGTQSYVITVSKSEAGRDYETIETEIPFDDVEQKYEPTYGHQSVLPGVRTVVDVTTDIVADFTVSAVSPFCTALPEVSFDIVGGRIRGTLPRTGASVYVYDQSLVTDANGERPILFDSNADGVVDDSDGASVGEYTITLTDPDYEFWHLNPENDDPMTVLVSADATVPCTMVIIDKTSTAPDVFFINVFEERVVDGSPIQVPITDARVRVRDVTTAYDEEDTTDRYGLVYFPTNENEPLTNLADYSITVTAPGYEDNTELSDKVVDGFSAFSVQLTPSP